MKIGLVFSGGGAKGAYQIGVWKALEEFGVSQNISVISGTSVGALNAALFAQGDYNHAEMTWRNINEEDILHFDIEKHLPNFASLFGLSSTVLFWFLSTGIFSRKGLSCIINNRLDFSKIRESRKHIYANCSERNLPLKLKPKYFSLHNVSNERFHQILLASSAIPVIFDNETIDDKSYTDGYFTDNTPIKPVYEEECNIIINVFLNRDSYIPHENYPKSVLIDIYPQDDLGGILNGVLNFRNISKNIDRGYEDALKILKPIYDMALEQFKFGKLLEYSKAQNLAFRKYMKTTLELDEQIDNVKKKISNSRLLFKGDNNDGIKTLR